MTNKAVQTRLTAEQLRAKFEEILSPAVDCKAPYAKVMISLLVKEAEAFRDKSEAELREEIERLRAELKELK